ncbi:hypothetical protein PFISCL1PPCAC_9142 [Pristionchus fissidentatus]|uniref:Uncharacterized protein n=1 Tax=Pristionchus fissidentatus TaxID=1538716 RepID=A0AAV5VGX5_9BILA|nr:hypothetical protein PFISCL1PPCAC_9142 [Pristionchus fissidentatus]
MPLTIGGGGPTYEDALSPFHRCDDSYYYGVTVGVLSTIVAFLTAAVVLLIVLLFCLVCREDRVRGAVNIERGRAPIAEDLRRPGSDAVQGGTAPPLTSPCIPSW